MKLRCLSYEVGFSLLASISIVGRPDPTAAPGPWKMAQA